MFKFAYPWAFIALPLPLLVWFLLPRATLNFSAALKVPFLNGIKSISEQSQEKMTKQKGLILLWVIWILLIFALASPLWVGEPRPMERQGYNIMLALDISPSMAVNDMAIQGQPVTRLTAVKRAAKQFVTDRTNDKIGLILFGERAYLLTPLTYDRQTILMRLDDSSVGLAGKTTSLGDALGLAVKRLRHVPANGRMVILLTDGVNNSGVLAPLKAAELAKAEGINVYTIGLGSEVDLQSFGGMFLSMNGTADLDEDTLKKIAQITGGRYFRATNLQSLQRIYTLINQMSTVTQEQAVVRPQHEYYPWPLALAVILCLGLMNGHRSLFSSLNRILLRRKADESMGGETFGHG